MGRFCWQAVNLLADWLECFATCVQALLGTVSCGCLAFSSLVVFFSLVMDLHPFFWSFTLGTYSLAFSKDSEEPHRFLKLFFCIAPLSLGCYCTISIHPSLFQLQSLSSQLSETTTLFIGPPSLCCNLEMVPGQKSGAAVGFTSFAFLLSGFTVPHCVLPTACK